jgi:hypothetical protein
MPVNGGAMILRLLGVRARAASTSTDDHDVAVADAAIARVLAAEAAAQDDGVRAEREAEALVDDARRRAREIADRAERRVRAARERFEATVAQEVARIAAEAAACDAPQPLGADERSAAVRAAVAVARELTGPAP